jgi:hypothetical protein
MSVGRSRTGITHGLVLFTLPPSLPRRDESLKAVSQWALISLGLLFPFSSCQLAAGGRRHPDYLRFPAHKLAVISTNTSANQGNSSSPRTEHRFLVAGARKYICIIWRNRFGEIREPAHFHAVIAAKICAPHPGSTEPNTSERPSLKTASAKQKTSVRTGNIRIPASNATAQTRQDDRC